MEADDEQEDGGDACAGPARCWYTVAALPLEFSLFPGAGRFSPFSFSVPDGSLRGVSVCVLTSGQLDGGSPSEKMKGLHTQELRQQSR